MNSTPEPQIPAPIKQALNEAITLTNCDREPIHMPGSIQAHGFLLARSLSTDAAPVVVASRNAVNFLARPMDQILGSSLSELFPAQDVEVLYRAVEAMRTDDRQRFLGSVCLQRHVYPSEEFQVVGYSRNNLQFFEFESSGPAPDQRDLNSVIADFVARLEQCRNPADLFHTLTAQIRHLTGFDRVMLYQFDKEGHGTVLAEDRNDRLPSYLGLRFPASDIPRQARELYIQNRVRIIPDVDYVPSPLVSSDNTIDTATLDLSFSVLRSVSPVHREYMRNMRTASSMSVSLVIEGRLWGLISAHHSEPRFAPYLVRSACDILSRIAATQIASGERAAEMSDAVRFKSIHTQLLTYMAAGENYIDGLTKHPEELFALTRAAGAAILVGDRCITLGQAPQPAEVLNLSNTLGTHLSSDVFATSQLDPRFENVDAVRAHASGIMAISLSQIHRMQILWFRPEVVQTVHWAGEPAKAHEIVDGVLQIHPRNSFVSWKEIVRGKSEPWTDAEIESAREFRHAVLEIVLKRAEELADIAAELRVVNRELEAFSYSVSHDLRAPFRHISGFAELLTLNESKNLSERGKRHLAAIVESAQFAGLLVDSLLNFSRLSRTPLDLKPVPMKMLVEDVWRDIERQDLRDRHVSLTVHDLPLVRADVTLMRQVWINLLSNAAKYTRGRDPGVITVRAKQQEKEIVFSIDDNGVGFDNHYAHKLFGVFQRLHRMEEFEGTGIGLANVRRIISRMGGRTWAEGRPGQGATFFFSIPSTSEVRTDKESS